MPSLSIILGTASTDVRPTTVLASATAAAHDVSTGIGEPRYFAAQPAAATGMANLTRGVGDEHRYFALPTTSRVVDVPGAIDHTGATDVTAALQSFLDGTPDGSVINFGVEGGVYKISAAIDLRNRNHLIFEGNGWTTLNNVANANVGSSYEKSFFWCSYLYTGPNHITFRNFTATAGAPTSPPSLQSGEFAAFVHIMGGSYIELDNITATGLYGDLVTFNENTQWGYIHDCTTPSFSRAFISIVCGSHMMVEDNVVGESGYGVFNIEPESGSIANITDVTIRNNTVLQFDFNTFVSVDGAHSGKVCSNITITGNTVTNDTLISLVGMTNSARLSNVVYSNNSSTTAGPGPLLRFCNIDGLVVDGNTQPVSSGSKCSFFSCTSITGSDAP